MKRVQIERITQVVPSEVLKKTEDEFRDYVRQVRIQFERELDILATRLTKTELLLIEHLNKQCPIKITKKKRKKK